MSTSEPSKPRRFRRVREYFQNIKDAYTVTRRTFPWVGWAMLGTSLGVVALVLGLAAALGQPVWLWTLLALMVAATADMAILSLLARRASYSQIAGKPGAAKLVLDQAGKGWFIEENPAAINPTTQDVVWRMVGRPGIVLVVEGPTGRTQKMVAEETKKIRRILSTVPLHVLHVGTEDGQVSLIDLSKTLRRLPTKPTRLTDSEITQVSRRLSSLSAKGLLPIPKGVDPMRARPDRRAMRGR